MYKKLSQNYFNQSTYYEAYEQQIIDRTHINDEKAILLIYIGITIHNKLNKKNETCSIAIQMLIESINKLCYFNKICIEQEIAHRTYKLKKNYYLLNYYKETHDNENVKKIVIENKFIINRTSFLKNITIYFNHPLLFNYIKTYLKTNNSYYFNHIVISYIDNWNITLGNETYIRSMITQLIKNPNYNSELITKLNNVICKEQFKNSIKTCQDILLNLIKNEAINPHKIIMFIHNYSIDLIDQTELVYMLLSKIKIARIHDFKKIIEFIHYIYFKVDVLSYELRNIFLNVLFKLITTKYHKKLLQILVDITLTQKVKLVNFFSYEHSEIAITLIDYIFKKHTQLENIVSQIEQSIIDVNKSKGLCLDELTATIIEEPVIIPPHVVLDKYTIYPYILIKNMNPFNRQPLTIPNIEEFNKNNSDLINFKKKNNYKIN